MELHIANKDNHGETVYDIKTRIPLILSAILVGAMIFDWFTSFGGFWQGLLVACQNLFFAIVIYVWVLATAVIPDDGVDPIKRFPMLIMLAQVMAFLGVAILTLNVLLLLIS